MRFDIDTGAIEKYPYWQFHIRPDYSLTVKQEVPLVEELRALLIQAVKRRLLSDVPLGLFLSGGIDSGTVLAAAASILPPENIRAFTIGFTEPTFDESSKARTMADAFGIEHNVSMLTLEEMQNNAHDILRQMSEPLGDASLIPTYTLAAFARKQVIVSLSGDGGDELFAGYDPFLALGPASLYNRMIPRGFHRLLRKAVNILPPGDANMSLDFKIKRMLRGLSYNNSYRLPVWMSPLEPSEIRELFTDPLSEEELYEDAVSIWETNDTLNDIDKALLFFTRFYLPNDILVKVDRATTMVSMESRAVFLDNDLVDFCTRLPDHFKLRGTNRKYLLKKALHGWIPGEILNQSKKGFGIPLNRWLRSMECPQIPANIRQEKISAKWDAHRQRKGDHRLFLWSAIALQNIQTLA